ncbi:gamma-glutamyl-gamma-aminobutyrate hydrolase family protein [Sciscionella sediminilitoris]|uniref:gamma-glutamyl-gamma-aminobutyrate hydrolase family protein n=1 Tax=Sciscionella sediminilitoris TaxID=1445613 RepID=UPI002100DBDE|nr:gamma-glutamyl-gamma-aminobutyrate hydrolase family protein [Sciscionella sp. SE31]
MTQALAHQLYGATVQTNSWHHQAVRECGPGVTATSHTTDGSIESIELTGHSVLGVQWHPEWHTELDPVFP